MLYDEVLRKKKINVLKRYVKSSPFKQKTCNDKKYYLGMKWLKYYPLNECIS